ncbi:MAG: CDGSH iron-sulfur domain-containing protein [Pseudomonadota bacterium]|nr:CDGSH iron-sulfur domain-containing protein [Pseudomonadota bacterium]
MSVETPVTNPTATPIAVTVESGKTYWWCACGLSKRQPFCDGSHKNTAVVPLRYQATESANKLFCVCKRTAAPPLCDGSNHACKGSPA